jgi:signal transduction histidine kinase
VAATLRPGVERKGLVMSTEIEDSVPDVVFGDPGRVEQILRSLVDNAAKFTKVGTIDIRVYRSGDGRWAMRVADTGIGIPETAREYIFEPFRQVDESVTREYGGMGLGLTIAKQLTMLMGGEISLESEVGQGSTFTVVLPVNSLEEGNDV